MEDMGKLRANKLQLIIISGSLNSVASLLYELSSASSVYFKQFNLIGEFLEWNSQFKR